MRKNLVLVTKGFDHQDTSDMNLRTSPKLEDESCQYKEKDFKNKIMS